MIGSQNAGAIYLLGPDPTSMTGSSGCIGSVVTFYGHEIYGGGMTADFGSYTSNVYNINVPIGDNDTANATVPSAPAGTYTVTITDRYGNGEFRAPLPSFRASSFHAVTGSRPVPRWRSNLGS